MRTMAALQLSNRIDFLCCQFFRKHLASLLACLAHSLGCRWFWSSLSLQWVCSCPREAMQFPKYFKQCVVNNTWANYQPALKINEPFPPFPNWSQIQDLCSRCSCWQQLSSEMCCPATDHFPHQGNIFIQLIVWENIYSWRSLQKPQP